MAKSKDARELAARLQRIQRLVTRLADVQHDATEQRALSARIHREIESVKYRTGKE